MSSDETDPVLNAWKYLRPAEEVSQTCIDNALDFVRLNFQLMILMQKLDIDYRVYPLLLAGAAAIAQQSANETDADCNAHTSN